MVSARKGQSRSEILIESQFGNYGIEIRVPIYEPKGDLVIIDEVVSRFYPSLGGKGVVKIMVSENEKNLETVKRLFQIFQDNNVQRGSAVAFVGGGVLQDLATLACSLYMRGLNWTFYPTTLQAMLDSCVGGKSSINFGSRKNAIGNFFPPRQIFISTDMLSTLSDEQIVSGLLEGIKIAIASKSETNFLELISDSNSLDVRQLPFVEIVDFTLRLKKIFVEDDEFDLGVRRLLNFGHTFGHAIESASGYRVPHGLSVGVGMLSAYELSRKLGLSVGIEAPIENYIVRQLRSLRSNFHTHLLTLDALIFLDSLRSDKKATHQNFVFILPSTEGLLEVPLSLEQQNKDLIFEALTRAIKRITM